MFAWDSGVYADAILGLLVVLILSNKSEEIMEYQISISQVLGLGLIAKKLAIEFGTLLGTGRHEYKIKTGHHYPIETLCISYREESEILSIGFDTGVSSALTIEKDDIIYDWIPVIRGTSSLTGAWSFDWQTLLLKEYKEKGCTDNI